MQGLLQLEEQGCHLSQQVRSRLRLGSSHVEGPGYFKVQPAGDRLGTSNLASNGTEGSTEDNGTSESSAAPFIKQCRCQHVNKISARW